jgi:hypothetical protein
MKGAVMRWLTVTGMTALLISALVQGPAQAQSCGGTQIGGGLGGPGMVVADLMRCRAEQARPAARSGVRLDQRGPRARMQPRPRRAKAPRQFREAPRPARRALLPRTARLP